MRRVNISACLAIVLLLSACSMATPSQVRTGEIRIEDRMKTVNIDPSTLTADQAGMIAEDYQRNGRGKMAVVVSYVRANPAARIKAEQQSVKIAQVFAAKGVRNMKVNMVAVNTVNHAEQAVVSYMAVTALPPRNCTRMPGYNGSDTLDNAMDYSFGCETQTLVSKMIVNPEDLMGRDGTPDGESRRHGTIVERYKSGTRNTPLEGQINASDVSTASGGG
jgi:pilus biogenesis lipoprotein CpaD